MDKEVSGMNNTEIVIPMPSGHKVGIYKREDGRVIVDVENPNGYIITDIGLTHREIRAIEEILRGAL